MIKHGWSFSRRLLEKRFFRTSHPGFARKQAENFKQTNEMTVDEYFNGIISLIMQYSPNNINEPEASNLILKNMRPGLSNAINRMHPCQEWSLEDLRSEALRRQADYDSRKIDEKRGKEAKGNFRNDRAGNGNFGNRGQGSRSRGGYRNYSRTFTRQHANAEENSTPEEREVVPFRASPGSNRGNRGFYRGRNYSPNYRGNFRGGFSKWSGPPRFQQQLPRSPPVDSNSQAQIYNPILDPSVKFEPDSSYTYSDASGSYDYQSYLDYVNSLDSVPARQHRVRK